MPDPIKIKFEGEEDDLTKAIREVRGEIDKLTKDTDELAKEQAEVNQKAKEHTTALKNQATATANLKRGLNDAVQELTGFNLAQISVIGGVGLLGREIVNTAKEFTGYINEMDRAAQQTGLTADEVSRLIQTADDFRVDQQAMTNAMTMAVQNGFVPSIENIAKLADEYKAIQDPVERTNRLQEIFGRQWREIVPLLEAGGDAIRNTAAGMADGLVVTDQMVEQNRKLAKSLDDLQDAWKAVEFAAAKSILPQLAGSMQIFAQNIDDLSTGSKNIFQVLAENQKQYATLEAIVRDNTDASYDWSDAEREAAKAAGGTTEKASGATTSIDDLSAAMDDGSESSAQLSENLLQSAPALEDIAAAAEVATKGFEDALMAWRNFISNIGASNGQHFQVTVDVNYSAGGGNTGSEGAHSTNLGRAASGRAGGGSISAGVPYPVGELGTEVIVPSRNGYVVSHTEAIEAIRSASLAERTGSRGSGGGVTIGSITLPGITNPQQFIAYMRQYERSRTKAGIGFAGS